MKRKGFLIALALTLSATVYQMVIAKAGTNGDVVYIRSYTPLNGGDSTNTGPDSTQIVVLNTAVVNADSLPATVVLEELLIDPSVFGRGSSYREVGLQDLVFVMDSATYAVVAGEPVPLSTHAQNVSNTAVQNAATQLNTPKY